jgi:hypothetical protein
MTEAQFEGRIVHLARLCGWRVAHFGALQARDGRWITPARYDGKGFPDLVLIHDQRGLCLFREVKTDTGRVSEEQTVWLLLLTKAGCDAAVWRPKDWPLIEHWLTGRKQGGAAPDGVPAHPRSARAARGPSPSTPTHEVAA